MSLPKTTENSDVRETIQIIYIIEKVLTRAIQKCKFY